MNPHGCDVAVLVQDRAKERVVLLNRFVNCLAGTRTEHTFAVIGSFVRDNGFLVELVRCINRVLRRESGNKEAILSTLVVANNWNDFVAAIL